MASISDIMRRLFPKGTNYGGDVRRDSIVDEGGRQPKDVAIEPTQP